ncbi:MAG: hypothetical protein KJ936_13130 [Proteobacteria bacterium]|nr:hypothetical protein [Pseudomonadota bacterium]MBU2228583.1 hypothetical protein [Pseudomonadota bacterium]MBU2261821.1 hypothetical protein [Pseudomonadota bacterium]
MEFLKSEFFTSTQLAVPLSHVVLLLILSTGALLFGRIKLAMIINYCFTLYWGFIFNIDLFSTEGLLKLNAYTLLYFGFGLIILILALIGLLHRE